VAANGVSETNKFTEQALTAVANLPVKPDLILITGDLTESGKAAQYRNLTAILRRALPRPVHVIPGNHDHRETLRTELAHLPGVTTDPSFVQYTVEDQPVRIVMLDTLVTGCPHGELSGGRLDWLDKTLSEQPSRPTLVAMHHPPFVTGIPHMDRIGLLDAVEFTAVITRHPQVERIICGHHHRPIIGRCAHAIVSISPSVAHQVALTFDPNDIGAFTFEPPAFHLHLWTGAGGFVTHTVFTDNYRGPFPFSGEA
jgi:3',5'-cyclic AMP phosphodiesterase CpdA